MTRKAVLERAAAAALGAVAFDTFDALERRSATEARRFVPLGVHRRSAQRGAAVALHIFEWSTTDGGHDGFRDNFPPYTPPSGPGLWEPTPPDFAPALQPYWGANRPFALRDVDACSPGPPPPYSEDPNSRFYAEAHECYVVVNGLTPEQEAIARFWSD